MKGTVTKHRFTDREDEVTGKRVRQLTSLPGNHHHLYFTSNSFTRDNRQVLFISDSWNDQPNLFRLDLETGEAVQLTENRSGYMQSYVYYDGRPYQGLGKASPSFNAESGRLLYIAGSEVRLLDVETLQDDVIYELPDAVMTAFTNLSADGRYACIPYIEAEAFDVGVRDANAIVAIRDKVARERLESRVLVIDTAAKQAEVRFSHPGWITHVSFHPDDPAQILFNHEGGYVPQRMWLYRDGQVEKLYDQAGDSSLWVCHELYQRDRKSVLYHGKKRLFTPECYSFIGSVDLATGQRYELAFPQNYTEYGHFSGGTNSELLVTDGVIDDKTIRLCEARWSKNELTWRPLCRHDSSFATQDVHPHPIFSYDDRFVLFTSDVHNDKAKGNLYLAEV